MFDILVGLAVGEKTEEAVVEVGERVGAGVEEGVFKGKEVCVGKDEDLGEQALRIWLTTKAPVPLAAQCRNCLRVIDFIWNSP